MVRADQGGLFIKSGVIAAAVAMLVACGGDSTLDKVKELQDQRDTAQKAVEAAAAAADTAAKDAVAAEALVTTKASEADAAVAAVADDVAAAGATVPVVAAYATGCTLVSGDDTAVAVAGAPGFYFFGGRPVALMSATNCVNPVTGSTLPELKAPAPVGDRIPAVTPVTTMLADGVELSTIRSVFFPDVTVEVALDDLLDDPVAVAATKPFVLQASVKASAIVEAAVANGESADTAKQALTTALKVEGAGIESVAAAVKADPVVVTRAVEAARQIASALGSAETVEAKQEAVKKLESVIAATKTVATGVKAGTAQAAELDVAKVEQEATAKAEVLSTATKVLTVEEKAAAVKTTVVAEVKKSLVEGVTSSAVSQATLASIAAANEEAAQRIAVANAAAEALRAARAAAELAAQAAKAAEDERARAELALQQAQQNLINAGGTGGGS